MKFSVMNDVWNVVGGAGVDRMIRRWGNLRDTCARQLATKLLTW